MDLSTYFENYSLSDDSIMKLKSYKDSLINSDTQPPDKNWFRLFKTESNQETITECQDNIVVNDTSKEVSETSIPEHEDLAMSSQFIATQIEKEKEPIIIPQMNDKQEKSDLTNITESICDMLDDADGTLSSDDLKNLMNYDINQIMEHLSDQLSLNGIHNLCNSLCSSDIDTTILFIKAVCTKILLRRMIELEKSQDEAKLLSITINAMTKKFPSDMCKWIFIPMINADIKDNTVISITIKFFINHQKLIPHEDFITTIEELKLWHVTVLMSLTNHTFDDATKNRLLKLLVDKALSFSSDNNYSKFVLKFIKMNLPFSETQKKMLGEIIGVNETVFKPSMQQIMHKM